MLAVGGTNLTLTPANTIASSGVWNDTGYPAPYEQTAGGGGGVSTFVKRPWWQPATSSQKTYRMVPDVAAFADPAPGYLIVCSQGVQGCGGVGGPDADGGRGHERGHAARCRHDRSVAPEGKPDRRAATRVRPAAALFAKGVYLDITGGDNVVFGGVNCCTAGAGFDLASGLGSPMADQSPRS